MEASMPSMPAAYYVNYRKTAKARRERKAHQVGVQEGVAMCCKLLQTFIGEKSVSGFAAAHLISKTLSPVSTAKT
jgi:hypothetical protein